MTGATSPLPERAAWSVRFHSDWAVGSGRGSASGLDDTVRVDGDGLPEVPGKTATGMWRDALELVLRPFPSASGWAEAIMGTETRENGPTPRDRPRPAAVAFRGAYISGPLQQHLAARPLVAGKLRLDQPAVKINDDGVADARMLRFLERARGGLVLNGEIERVPALTAAWTTVQQRVAAALIRVAASQMHHMGGDRRRGAGLCSVTVQGLGPVDNLKHAVHVLKTDLAHTDIPEPPQNTPATLLAPTAQSETAVVGLEIQCELAVIVPARTLGNIRRSLDFVPGSMLLPEITTRLRAEGLDADQAVRSGRLTVTDATVDVGGRRGLPMPACLAVEKGGRPLTDRTINLAIEPPADPVRFARGGYVGEPDGEALPPATQMPLVTRTHNVVDDDVQRPTARVGGVYTYESIPAGTVLRSEVRISANWSEIAVAALSGTWRLGRASKDEYGRVRVQADAGPAPTEPEPDGESDEVLLWFTSTAVLTDEWMQPVTDVAGLRRAVQATLRGTGEWEGTVADPGGTDRVTAQVQVDRRESWHRRWGLPRPSIIGIAGGSVLRCVFEPQVPERLLRRLEREGIGDRRAEGFGRLRVNPMWLLAPTSDKKTSPRSSGQPEAEPDAEPLGAADAALVTSLETALVKWEIDTRAGALQPAQVLADGDEDAMATVRRSQWGAIRERLSAAAGADDAANAKQELRKIPALFASSAARREAWGDRTRPVRNALERLAEGSAWEQLGLSNSDDLVALGVRAESADLLFDRLHGYAVAQVLLTALSRTRSADRKED